MNKTAKEMFEELGFGVRKSKSPNSNIYWIIAEDDTLQIRISDYGMIFFNSKTGMDSYISVDTLKAINKQIEELGWNERD